MDDLNRSISQHLKTGQYYLDAHNWYANKFIFPASERAYLRILLSLFATGFAILALFYYYANPAQKQTLYLNSLPDIASQYSMIHPLGDPELSPQENITSYVIAKYVIAREAYKFSSIADRLAYIKNNSTGAQFGNYSDAVSINNPLSPILLYQDSSERKISVHDVEIVKSNNQYLKAIVHFTSTLNNMILNKSSSDDLIATISFQIDNIEDAMKKKERNLRFLVVDYSIDRNKQN